MIARFFVFFFFSVRRRHTRCALVTGVQTCALPISLKARGMDGVKLVISDAHTGLIAAIETVFQGSSWQRCRVHFMRNVLANVPKTAGPMVASIIRTIFAQPDPEHVYAQFDEVVRMLTRSHPKIAEMLETARTDLLAFAEFPYPHWRQIWSTNPLERVNTEIKRRSEEHTSEIQSLMRHSDAVFR